MDDSFNSSVTSKGILQIFLSKWTNELIVAVLLWIRGMYGVEAGVCNRSQTQFMPHDTNLAKFYTISFQEIRELI